MATDGHGLDYKMILRYELLLSAKKVKEHINRKEGFISGQNPTKFNCMSISIDYKAKSKGEIGWGRLLSLVE